MEMQLDYDVYKDEVIIIRFDSEMFKGFTGYDKNNPEPYFKLHPRSKKPPMDWLGKTRNGMLPSWNRFINCPNRIIQDTWKKDLNDYTRYCIQQQYIPRAYLSECIIVAVQYRPTKAKSDNDNTYVKATLDAMVKEEVIQEDNHTVVRYFGSYTVYDKQDPRTEIRIYPIIKGVYDFNDVLQIATYEINNLEKQYNQG